MFKVNEYFDGKVKSISFQNGEFPATVGVMAKGEYTFGTSKIEYMTIVSGNVSVKLPNENEFKSYSANQTFIVQANTSFDIKVLEETSYLCVYK